MGNMGFIISGVTSTDRSLVIISLIFPYGPSNSPFETLKEERTTFQTLTLHSEIKNDQTSRNGLLSGISSGPASLAFRALGKSANTGGRSNFLKKMGK